MLPSKERLQLTGCVCAADEGAVPCAGAGALLQRVLGDCGADVPGRLERQAARGLRPDHLPLR